MTNSRENKKLLKKGNDHHCSLHDLAIAQCFHMHSDVDSVATSVKYTGGMGSWRRVCVCGVGTGVCEQEIILIFHCG